MRRVAQRMLRGPREAVFQFRHGPAAGMYFSCLTSHRYFFAREAYEADLLESVERFVWKGAVVHDIGAHFGFWALTLSRLCGAKGKVFAFEPIPENRLRLARNLQLNSVRNVTIVPLAVSDSAGNVQMASNGSMSKAGVGELSVETTTLDGFCKHHLVPNFVMVDVEGFAGSVFRGASAVYRENRIPTICEIHNSDELQEFTDFMGERTIKNLSGRERFAYRLLAY